MSGHLDSSEIEKILLQDSHIVTIEHAEGYAFLHIDSSLFEKKRDTIEEYVKDLQAFLAMPYIVDKFTNHPLRSRWKLVDAPKRYGQEVLDFLQNNALRAMMFMTAYHCTDYVNPANYIGKNKEEFGRKFDDLLDTYAGLTKQLGDVAPIEKVKSLKQKVYTLLEFLSQQSPAS